MTVLANSRRDLFAALVLLLAAPALAAQPAGSAANPGADTPERLIARTLDAFARGVPTAFDSAYPFPDARQLVRWSVNAGWGRQAVGGRVIRASDSSAIIQLSGHPVTGSSGYETSLGRMFTGLYEAKLYRTGWQLTSRLPIAMGNRIRSHAAAVILEPGRGLRVSDTLDMTVESGDGIWLSLNRVAQLRRATVNGEPVRYDLSGGLLWIDADRRGPARVHLEYELDVRRDSARNPNFGRFEDDFGHVRDQHYWLPFFGFDAPEGVADFRLTITAPVSVTVVTGLPQRDTVVNGRRIVRAVSGHPTSAVTLMYDRAWRPLRRSLGTTSADLFLTDSVAPSRGGIDSALVSVYATLARRFGDAPGTYMALVQGRGLNGWGWLFRSNDMVVAGPEGGPLERTGAIPRAMFGHEIAHGWTSSSGAGRNLLSEGWAMFAEGFLIAEGQGADAERRFWEWMRSAYHTEGHEGKNTLLGDDFNSGVSYAKGGWVLRMLHDAMGREAFERGMRVFMNAAADGKSSLSMFTAAMSREVSWSVADFLRPWVDEARIPDLSARIDAGRVVVRQHGPLFTLPLDVQIHGANGERVNRRIWISHREDTIAVDAVPAPTRVRLDPEHRILMHRTEGDTVRLALDAGDAKEVAVRGSFTSAPVSAARAANGRWEVVLPVTEGTYGYYWVVDGKRRDAADGGVLVVPASIPLARASSYPR